MTALELSALETLQSSKYSAILDVIDSLRAQGLSDFLPLPQLIVCGDQSSGKSSLLEAISGVPFPKKDNLCTRFATEVILRRDDSLKDSRAVVSITPGATRSDNDREHLLAFRYDLETMTKLPSLVDAAKEAMGLGSLGAAFSTDVLRIEIIGPRMPQLTIVDLPGLIHSETKLQTTQDVELVASLVESYMKQTRSIILAVISAKNDYANQIVLKKARKFDPEGLRTLGIITKPDDLRSGTASEIAYFGLAKNQDVRFKLGWHVVRNLDSTDSTADRLSRDAVEADFFASGGWISLDPAILGINSLRVRLSAVLFDQINHELPNLIHEIERGIEESSKELSRLGKSRETEEEQRIFLSDVGQAFGELCRATCDGAYEHHWFQAANDDSEGPRRIRAFVQNESLAFAARMIRRGATYELPATVWDVVDSNDIAEVTKTVDADGARQHAVDMAKDLLKEHRGRELPGTFNPLLVGALFRRYSSGWRSLAQAHLQKVWDGCKWSVEALLCYITDPDVSDMCCRLIIETELENLRSNAMQTLDSFLKELDRHPITYNHYFRNEYDGNLKRRWLKHVRACLETFMERKDGPLREADLDTAISFVSRSSNPDVDDAAAEDMVDYMAAYYKVALKRLIDNIPALILEPCIVQKLPAMLSPSKAWQLDSKIVDEIAGENQSKKDRRIQLERKLKILRAGESTCKRYALRAIDLKAKVRGIKIIEDPEDAALSISSETESLPRSELEVIVSCEEA